MCGKLKAIHYVRPAHVKAGFRGVIRHCIDNIYRKGNPGTDDPHGEKSLSSSGGTYFVLQFIAVSSCSLLLHSIFHTFVVRHIVPSM